MSNTTQFERYQRLLEYLDNNIGNVMTPEKMESVCFYSYRNINRIFLALKNETIGQYVKRMRLEKAAEYLKYSTTSVADISQAVGFSDTASFSKAFKKMMGVSPTIYRESVAVQRQMVRHSNESQNGGSFQKVEFEIVHRPEQSVIYSQYRGSYENIDAMTKLWESHIAYAVKNNLLTSKTTYLAEILDDNEITSRLNCRYNALISIDDNVSFESDGAFRRKTIPAGTYAKFLHKGSHALSEETYSRIYSQWMQVVGLELADSATLEIYSDDDGEVLEEDMITEIYIPVLL